MVAQTRNIPPYSNSVNASDNADENIRVTFRGSSNRQLPIEIANHVKSYHSPIVNFSLRFSPMPDTKAALISLDGYV